MSIAQYRQKHKKLLDLILSYMLDFGPIFTFVITYELSNYYAATWVLIIFTVLSVFAAYIKDNRIPYFALFVATITVIFGSLTLELHNSEFIQIRDSVYDFILATSMLVALVTRYNLLKRLFGHLVEITESEWRWVTLNWCGHFYFLVLCNEIVRRYHDNIWIKYKMLAMAFTISHGLIMIYFYYNKHKKEIE